MKKVFSIVLLSLLAGCSSSTGGDTTCPPNFTMKECEEYKYWEEYYKENPEQVEEDLKYFLDLE